MIFDNSANEISVATAGYKPIKILKDNDDKFIDLQPEGVGVGIMEDYDYESVKMKLESNDLILLASAGLSKTKNREGTPFGDEKLHRLVLANAEQTCEEIIEGIKNTVLYYGAGTAQEDDITIVIAKVK